MSNGALTKEDGWPSSLTTFVGCGCAKRGYLGFTSIFDLEDIREKLHKSNYV
jgi:hypothetical protein